MTLKITNITAQKQFFSELDHKQLFRYPDTGGLNMKTDPNHYFNFAGADIYPVNNQKELAVIPVIGDLKWYDQNIGL